MCALCVIVDIHVHVFVQAHIHVYGQHCVSFLKSCLPFLWDSISEIWNLAWRPKDPPFSIRLGAGQANIRSHTRMAITLHTEPPPCPLLFPLLFFFFVCFLICLSLVLGHLLPFSCKHMINFELLLPPYFTAIPSFPECFWVPLGTRGFVRWNGII